MLQCRRAKEDDAMLYYEWANDPMVRAQSFKSDKIPLENHLVWFEKMIGDKSSIMLIFEDDRGNAAGQIRYKQENEEAFIIGISVSASFRGQGLASKMLTMASEYFFEEHPSKIIKAFIKCDNIASISSFEKAGYENPKELEIDGIKSIVYTKENKNAD